MLAMRPPMDLPPMTSRWPGASREETDAIMASYSGMSFSALGGGFFVPPSRRAAIYANSNRVTPMPRSESNAVIASMNGEVIPAPAPCARIRCGAGASGPDVSVKALVNVMVRVLVKES